MSYQQGLILDRTGNRRDRLGDAVGSNHLISTITFFNIPVNLNEGLWAFAIGVPRKLHPRILVNYSIANLVWLELLFFFQPIGKQRFIDADGTTRCMICLKAAVEALVPMRLIAMAIARKLSDG